MKNILIFIIVVFLLGVVAYAYKNNQSDILKNAGSDEITKNDKFINEPDFNTLLEEELAQEWDRRNANFQNGDDVMMFGGEYIDYQPELLSRADGGDVVLFFHATWCPTCKVLDTNLKQELSDFPKDLTVLKVNYDKEKVLKDKYTVTYQHTLVQVDSQGNELAKWTGGNDLQSILKNLE